VSALAQALARGLWDVPSALWTPESRLHWLFLLSFAALGAAVWWATVRPRVGLLAWLFPRDVYLHPSARVDYGLFAVNQVLLAVAALAGGLTVAAVAGFARARLTAWWGPAGPPRAAGPVAVLLFSLGVAVVRDFAIYLDHRLKHAIPFLWELHKVHHSAEVLTPVTQHRMHPLEYLLVRPLGALFHGLFQGAVLYATSLRITPLTLFGVNLFFGLFYLLGNNLRHSHVWLSYGRAGYVLLSPAQHQIHHSVDPKHWNKNYGQMLSVWDWLGGSLYVTRAREALTFGLGEAQPHPTVWAALVRPLLSISGVASRTRPRGRPAADPPGRGRRPAARSRRGAGRCGRPRSAPPGGGRRGSRR
jgi:sterol desaturase/sphingolipid hydroxylase (fatty acid hydroxylase superfamily)